VQKIKTDQKPGQMPSRFLFDGMMDHVWISFERSVICNLS
jgi:hypothetical protein